jgi:dihydroflavonol-4-reductase
MVTVVTGAAGHVGTNLCLALRAEGEVVRAVDIREPERAVRHGAMWIRADIRDEAAMARALDSCEVVYHLAAVISVAGDAGGQVSSVNVDGVGVVARAALAARVRRLVHCSSVHAFDLAALAGQPVTEKSPRAERPDLPAYDRSKAAGEVELRKVVDDGLDAVVIHPTGIIGPVDDTPSRMGSVLRAIWRQRMPALVEGGFDWIDVRDAVEALRSACMLGRRGESYLVSGHRLSIADLATAAAAVAGMPAPDRRAPMRLVRALGPVSDLLARRTPLAPTREALHALATFPTVDGSKARRELFLRQPRPFQKTLSDLYSFFVSAGRLEAPSRRTDQDGGGNALE